ncbi:hypothetical protein MLD52_20440 [Puniceicoccaceae bacterium K14]|nr:hypothetical protein [Puniceicoccaceae bacterium K14]
MKSNSQNLLQIVFWKKAMIFAFLVFFLLTLIDYFKGGLDDRAAWLWPMLFVPLILYLLGVIYGDVPARFYKIDSLKPFPVPFAHQYDRCVLALIVLFTGLFLNFLLFLAAITFDSGHFLIGLYSLYMVLMLLELPNSLRIFRFIQHINTMQYVNVVNPETFRKAIDYYKPSQFELTGQSRTDYLKDLYKSLMEEAKKLAVKESPLKEEQQIALNLAVRSGEALRRCKISAQEENYPRLRANLLILEALEQCVSLELPQEYTGFKKLATEND